MIITDEKVEPYFGSRKVGANVMRASNPFGPQTIFDNPLYLERNVYRIGNRIYFYDSVDEVTQMLLEQLLKEATQELAQQRALELLNTGDINATIYIYINSPGGLCTSGFALYDIIKESRIPITTVISGAADSAATLIFLAGKYRFMTPNSTFLMHQCSWGCWGQNRLMQDMAKNAEKVMMKLRRIYFNETKFAEVGSEVSGIKIVDDKTRIAAIQAQLEHDIEWSYDECMSFGVINEEEVDPTLTDDEMSEVENFIESLLKKREKKTEEASEPPKKEESKTKQVEKAPAKKSTKKSKGSKSEVKETSENK